MSEIFEYVEYKYINLRLYANTRFVVVEFGIRSGKTFDILHLIVRNCIIDRIGMKLVVVQSILITAISTYYK